MSPVGARTISDEQIRPRPTATIAGLGLRNIEIYVFNTYGLSSFGTTLPTVSPLLKTPPNVLYGHSLWFFCRAMDGFVNAFESPTYASSF